MRVSTNKDDQGRISIALELDEPSARRMKELTKGKESWPLAVLFDNRIVAIQAIHERASDRIVLTGGDQGFDAKLAGKIVRSLSGCMLREAERHHRGAEEAKRRAIEKAGRKEEE